MDEDKQRIATQIRDNTRKVKKLIEQYALWVHLIYKNRSLVARQLWTTTGDGERDCLGLIERCYDDVSVYEQVSDSLDSVNDQMSDREEVDGLSKQYLNLVLLELQFNGTLPNLESNLNFLSEHENIVLDPNYDLTLTDNIYRNINHCLKSGEALLTGYLKVFAQLGAFEDFSTIEHSAVIVGANGSGKSSFSRSTRRVLGNSVAIISAQKLFNVSKVTAISNTRQPLLAVRNFQKEDKLGRNENEQKQKLSDLHNLVLALMTEDFQVGSKFHRESEHSEIDRPNSRLSVVVKLWNEIVSHRRLILDQMDILVECTDDGSIYQFAELSDGEKAIFYYISHIVIAKADAFIIIDEPENHLHLGLVDLLWNKLEEVREDCKFIYLTHSLDFASSRIQATKYWCKSFTHPASWDILPLPNNDDLPESLVMELLGSRKRILFCEGEKSSLDYKLYTLLFPDFTIKPVRGHINVINYTRAFNNSGGTFGNSAIGIVDGDYHSEEKRASWLKDSIVCLEVQEIENILCDAEILAAAIDEYDCEPGRLEQAKEKLIQTICNDKERQIVDYTTQLVNQRLAGGLLKKVKTTIELKDQLNSVVGSLEVEKTVRERKELIEEIIASEDYDRALKHYNNKGLPGIIGGVIDREFRYKVFKLLGKSDELRAKIIDKYFKKVNQLV